MAQNGNIKETRRYKIYCCECEKKQYCTLVSGEFIYPHRIDLWNLKFWRCPVCCGYVGTHRNSARFAPLDNIPTLEMKKSRQKIHALLDPLWKEEGYSRTKVYDYLSAKLGFQYHTAKLRSDEECRHVYSLLLTIKEYIPKNKGG